MEEEEEEEDKRRICVLEAEVRKSAPHTTPPVKMPPAANAADVADWKAAIRDQLAARDGSPQMRMLCQIVGARKSIGSTRQVLQ